MDLTIINKIEEKYDNKRIKKNCKLIIKKHSFKSAKDLGHFTELVVLLYIYGMYDESIEVCNLLNDISFTGNYSIWDQVENARLVKIRILRSRKQEKEANIILNTLLPHENRSVWMNQIRTLEIYDRNIMDAKMRNDERDIVGWQLIKYEIMIRFAELPEFPIDKVKLNKNIEMLEKELRTRIK